MTPLPLYVKVDRSRIVARQTCPGRRFYEYDYNKTGISPVQRGAALEFGIAMHNVLERVLRAASSPEPVAENDLWDAIRSDVVVPFSKAVYQKVLAETKDEAQAGHRSNEQSWLLEMLTYGWYRQRLPKILEEYDIESVEQEFTAELADDMRLMLRIDAVLRHKATKLLHILDFKSLGDVSNDWMVKQEHSAQTSLYIYALEQHLGEYVAGIMYEGLAKGRTRTDTNDKSPWFGYLLQVTPLCYVYTHEQEGVRHEYTKAKGWKKTPAWHIATVPAMYTTLRECYEGDLPQYSVVPPVRPPQQALERTIRQTVYAERDYHNKLAQIQAYLSRGNEDGAKELQDTVLELHYGSCYKYGKDHPCPFASICHGGASPDDPTQFVPRTPHHAGEFEDGE